MQKLSLAILLTLSSLYAKSSDGIVPTDPSIIAWATGPLLCPAYTTVPGGSYNVEPYLFVSAIYGNYNKSWNVVKESTFIQTSYYLFAQLGLTDHFNISLSPQLFYQSWKNSSSANIGDLPLQAYFAICDENIHGIKPGIILAVKANVPIGRYQNLSPDDFLVQSIGSGSWKPALAFVIGKQIHLNDIHFLTVRAFFSTQFRNKLSVRGFHNYGGSYGTKGKITLNTQYTAIGSFEYSFSRHGVFACDFLWQHNNKITFKGKPGDLLFLGSRIPATNGLPSLDMFSIAPAFEYNFNANVGVIGGVWWSLTGRNSPAFITPTFALNIEY
jgi:hypothetical protein